MRIKGGRERERRLLIEMILQRSKLERPFIGFMYKGSLLTVNDLIMMLIMTTIKNVHELPN